MTDSRKVYSVPVEFKLTTRVFVLATNAVDAVEQVKALDLEELYQFDDEQWWIDAPERIDLDDSTVDRILGTATIQPQYTPHDHPDWYGEPKK